MLRWDEDKIEVNPEDVAYRNEVKDAVFLIMDAVEQEITNITTRTREQYSCDKYMSVSKERWTRS